MKEKILEAFKALGLKVEDLDGTAYGFHYEGRSFLLLPNEDDDEFLNIALPCVLEKDDVDEETFIEAMEKLNSTLRYVKAYKAFGGMTLFYERELSGEEDLKEVIRRMVYHLEAGHFFLHHRLLGSNDDGDSSSEGGSDSDITEMIESKDEDVA